VCRRRVTGPPTQWFGLWGYALRALGGDDQLNTNNTGLRSVATTLSPLLQTADAHVHTCGCPPGRGAEEAEIMMESVYKGWDIHTARWSIMRLRRRHPR